ncbi:MAG TPA: F0F1 ATP synthase subunit delta [Mariprofundaceae bacterium]|nr:F0F1 ATP synthase subunit delta [Mariprofundaceae bacterium]
MSTLRISRRYARALFELIGEGAKLRPGLEALATVAADASAAEFLGSPAVTAADKSAVALKAAGKLPKELESLVALLAGRNKLTLLPEIRDMVEEMVRQSESELVAEVTVAAPLKADAQEKIAKALTASVGRSVRLDVHEDASIIGGMIVKLGDRQIDYSLRSRLDGLKQAIAG